jgi:hypothetical protein
MSLFHDNWQLCISKNHLGYEYWHNSRTDRRFWRKKEPCDNVHKVAVIVPFRDLRAEQKRYQQMMKFIPFMEEYLLKEDVAFKIFIIEQSNDGRKFNRGKLLNVGYDLAAKMGYSIFVFHDVDLLPSEELRSYYVCYPIEGPVHVARVWDRYNENPKYFGGVVTFSQSDYENINGYPNNYWGK